MGVVRRYIDILNNYSFSLLHCISSFLAAASLLHCSFKKSFFPLFKKKKKKKKVKWRFFLLPAART